MKVLVLGASGATGFNVVTQLLKHDFQVRVIVRSDVKFSSLKDDKNLEIIKASIPDIDNQSMSEYLSDAGAVISCLGHNLTLKGIFGKPHKLVVDALTKTANSIIENNSDVPVKIILMNTTACLNKSQHEKFSFKENLVINFMRFILPPQRDNEKALKYLFEGVGENNKHIEWVAVRPDTLVDENEVTEYTIEPSTIRSPVFDAGNTSRINVADFMARLLADANLWDSWRYKTPVIYNVDEESY